MPTDMDAVLAYYNQIKDQKGPGASKTTFIKWTEGSNIIRIIPPFGDRSFFWLQRDQAFAGPSTPRGKPIIPPSQFGQPDPLMDYLAELRKKDDEVSKKRLSKWSPKTRYFVWVVLLEVNGAAKDKEGISYESIGPQLWCMSFDRIKDILAIMADPAWGDLTHPKTGKTITVAYTPGEKTKNGFAQFRINARPGDYPITDESWIATDLFENCQALEPSKPEYITAVLNGTEEAYFASLRQDDETPAPAIEETPSEPPAQPGSETVAMDAQLQALRAKNAAAGRASGLQNRVMEPDPAPVPPPPDDPNATPHDLLQKVWWAGIQGESKELTGKQVQAYVDKGFPHIQIMLKGEKNGSWQRADKVGFKVATDEAPPAPPPPSDVTQDLQNALES